MAQHHPLFWFTKETAEPRTALWHSTDNEENYHEMQAHGPNPFKPGDFTYNFNRAGFRSDEFDLPSELPIIFIGCSNTEGIGLPIEMTWSYRLLEKIRAETGKTIPYWNLSISGASTDTLASQMLYAHRVLKIRPKFVFGWIPPLYCRDFCVKSSREFHYSQLVGSKYPQAIAELIVPLFTDKYFYMHQTMRSLRTVGLLQELWDAKMVLTYYAGHAFDAMQAELTNTKMIPLPKGATIEARDSMHYGPKYNEDVAENFWAAVQPMLSEYQD